MKPYSLPLLITLILLPSPAQAQTPVTQTPVTQTPVTQTTQAASRPLLPMDGTKQLQLQLVNCQNPIDCWLADRLLPRSTSITTRQLQFANQNTTAINILNTAIVAEGKLTGYQLTPNELQLPTTESLAPNQISSLPLNLNRTKIPPDQYTGNVYLVLGNQSDWVTLPINLSVRTGPLFPLLILISGILLGRLLKYMQERGEPQANVLQEINELDYQLRSIDPADQAILVPIIAQARRETYREKFDEAQAKLKLVRDRLEALGNLRTLENQLEQRIEPIPDETVNSAIETVQSARKALIQGEDRAARNDIQEVSNLLNNSGARSASSQSLASLQQVTESLNQIETIDRLSKSPMKVGNIGNWLKRSLIEFSGVSDRARAEATFWVVRPVLSLVLLGGLSATGLGSLYVEKGETFGARPFSDYLSLILWGLSADVASRSLSNLSKATSTKE